MRRQRPPARQRGSTLVEAALVLGIFLFVLIAILDFAQIFYLHHSLVERVRNSARTAVVEKLTSEQMTDLIVYGRKDPEPGQKGFFGLTPSNVYTFTVDQGSSEARLYVRVTGLRFLVLSPLMTHSARNLPVELTIPMEEP